METIDFGVLSIIPPALSIILALFTREVISSLFIGIFSGAAIYAVYTNSGFLEIFKIIFTTMANALEKNIMIIISISMLGALIYIVTIAGGTYAYGKWASGKMKSRKSVQLMTAFLGFVLSVDDYFDCLTVGAVMKPISDKHRISRVKFAYIIDSMAAPVCIIAPMSSWAASISSCIDSTGLNGMMTFIETIPYNFYALLTILLVVVLSCVDLDFGPMAKFEKRAADGLDLGASSQESSSTKLHTNKKGTVIDLILPILLLMVMSLFMMLETGGFFEGVPAAQALGRGNSGLSIAVSSMLSLFVALVLFVPRKLLTFKNFVGGVPKGIESMVSSFIILALAWTMSDTCQNLLGTGNYIGDLVENSSIPAMFMPAIIFLVSGLLSLSMGTSWGTFSILIPIVVMIFQKLAPDMIIVSLSATLAGAVFGDHCSPISDTMILSSTGAECNHMDHVATQMPYSIFVACISFVGYLIIGITRNLAVSLGVSVLIFTAFLLILKFFKKRGKNLPNIFGSA